MMWNHFTFGDTRSDDFGVVISGDSVHNAPERQYELVSIPGKNGELAIDRGSYSNIEVTYPCFIVRDLSRNVEDFRNELLSQTGYVRLEDTYHPDEFRLGIYTGGFEVEPELRQRVGSFELTFNCKPQRFLKSGETEVPFTVDALIIDESSNYITDESGNLLVSDMPGATSIVNPTGFPSKPLLIITGIGTVGIGDITITVTGDPLQVIYIDCETMEAYTKNGSAIVSANSRVSFSGNEYPTLGPGRTGITFSVSDLSIVPRWWRL